MQRGRQAGKEARERWPGPAGQALYVGQAGGDLRPCVPASFDQAGQASVAWRGVAWSGVEWSGPA